MTLPTEQNTRTYTGDGSTVAFSFPYLFYSNSHLVVKINGVTKTIDSDYEVTGAEAESGGTVTFTSAPANNSAIILQRVVPYTQETDLENFDGNPADVTEKQFDLLSMADQQLNEQTQRAILSPIGTELDSNTITGTVDATPRAIVLTTSGPAVGPTVEDIEDAEENAIAAQAAQTATQNLANLVAIAQQQTESYVEAIADILEGLDGGFGDGKDQIFVDGVDYAAGVDDSITLTQLPLPVNEKTLAIFFYGTVGAGVRIASDIYTYDSNTGIITFIVPIIADTDRIMVTWITPLGIGVPAASSVNWTTNIVNTLGSKIAGWAAGGTAALYDWVTTITGASTNAQFPTAKAVYDLIDPVSAGRIVQTVREEKTDTGSVNMATPGTVYALGPTVAITATSGRTVRVSAKFSMGFNTETFLYYILYKDGVPIEESTGDARGSRARVTGAIYIASANKMGEFCFEYDDVAADGGEHTYDIRFVSLNNGLLYINRSSTDTNATNYYTAYSYIKADEIS